MENLNAFSPASVSRFNDMEAIELVTTSHRRHAQNFADGSKLEALEAHTANESTWIERLLLNLLSYSLVLLPIAFIVIATKYKLFPEAILSSALVQWFVHGAAIEGGGGGGGGGNSKSGSSQTEYNKLLLDEDSSKPTTATVRSNPHRAESGSKPGSTTIEFLFCLLGLQVSYLIWGLLQEKIMTTEYPVSGSSHDQLNDLNSVDARGQHDQNSSSIPLNHQAQTKTVRFNDSQFLVFINRLMAFVTAIVAFVYSRHRESQMHSHRYAHNATGRQLMGHNSTRGSNQKPSAPLYKLVYSSLSNILSSWCQYEALKYVNFPTQCLSKSCKVIPVMLMSKLLMGKRYPCIDYFCAFLLATGMFVFMLNQPIGELNNKHPHPHQDHGSNKQSTPDHQETLARRSSSLALSGLTILALYLTFDSFTSNWQQSLYSRYDISNWQMMAASNFYSILLTLTSLHQLGNLRPAFELLGDSRTLLRDCLLMSLMSSMGQMFVYFTIKRFGSVLFAVIMTLRQFLSILLSCTIYKHQLNAGSSLGLLLVFLVVGFQVWHKSATRAGLLQAAARKASGSSNSELTGAGRRAQSFPLASPAGRQLLSNGNGHNVSNVA